MSTLRTTLLHENWWFTSDAWNAPDARPEWTAIGWLRATIPGHVHLDLVQNGIIAHPFERMHELGCQWVDERRFSYRSEFEWQPSAQYPRRVLRFDGLDTICSVHLNGELLAEHDNMFEPLELDVSSKLRPGANCLELRFEPAVSVGEARARSYFSAEGLGSKVERFEERSFVRKAQYMFGWDWGPRLVSCGIWRPVRLIEFHARIRDVHVRQQHQDDGSVHVQVASEVEGEGVVVHDFAERLSVGDGEIARLAAPRLWQPFGPDKPALYELTSYLCPPHFELSALPADPNLARQALLTAARDVRVTRIGLRRLRLLQEPDAFGESFEFEVNGQRLWSLGANWIPDHSFPSQVTRAELETRLGAAKALGMNMLRVWGGGVYESDDFYDVCDELGILVWQDFPFACAYYPDTGEWPARIAREARENIRRLRNHPSLALWCGNNENQQMHQDRWGKAEAHPARLYGERLYEGVLPELLRELDPERPYVPGSPYGGERVNAGGKGDQHYWDVWHGRGDWQHYRDSKARFSSEYGFASSCSLRAWQSVFAHDSAASISQRDIRDAIVRFHDKTRKGYETFLSYVALHYPQAETLAEWVYYSQLNQRDAMRAAIEHYRRSEFCKGSLIWQLNDCWPVQSWALIDSQGQYKAACYELSRLYAPELLSIVVEAERVQIWGIIDNLSREHRLEGPLKLSAHALVTGEPLIERSATARVQSGERKILLELPLSELPSRQVLIVARLGDRRTSRLLEEPKQLELPAPCALYYSVQRGALSIQTETPLFDLMLTDAQGTRHFAQNFLTIPTPGIFDVPYTGAGHGIEARSLAGRHTCVDYANTR